MRTIQRRRNRISAWLPVLGTAALSLLVAGTALAVNPASGNLTTGEGIEIIIDQPLDGAAVPVGVDLPVTGRTNIPEIPASNLANILYVVDVSGSTAGPSGQDCDGDGVGGGLGDDFNGDGTFGDTLDCEISGVLALNASLGASPDFDGGVIPFGSSSVVADVSPLAGGQPFTSPLTFDLDGNGFPDIEDVVRSLDQGSVLLFEPFGVGTGTDFNDALLYMNSAFATQAFGEVDIAFFLSDGFGSLSVGPGTILQAVADAGTTVNTYSVGSGGSGCGVGSDLQAIADATGGTCTVVTDPSTLAAALTGTAPRGIDHVEVTFNGGAPIVGTLDALGNWEATVPAAQVVLGSNLPVTATVEATEGTRITADIAVDVVNIAGDCGPDYVAKDVGFLIQDQRRAFQCVHVTTHFDIYYNISNRRNKVPVNGVMVKTTQPVLLADNWTYTESTNAFVAGANSIPDYVDQIAHSLENAYGVYDGVLGYDEPSTDDGRLDVALWDIQSRGPFGVFMAPAGYTVPELIQMVPNAVLPEQLGRHELFHSFQWEYGVSPNLGFLGSPQHWFIEASAEWAVHYTFASGVAPTPAADAREPNYYDHSIDIFLGDTRDVLYVAETSGTRQYGSFIFPEYLESQTGGPTVVREIWEGTRSSGSTLTAIEDRFGLTASEELLHDFWIAAYLLSDNSSALPVEWTFDGDPAVSDWRGELGSHGTGGNPPHGTPDRAHRYRLDLDRRGSVRSDNQYLFSTGAVYVDLLWPNNRAGDLEVRVDQFSLLDLRATLLVFDTYPDQLCSSHELTPGVTQTVSVGRNCDFATLVVTYPYIYLTDLAQVHYSASFDSP